ncbi:MAG TPA: hypothetical protein VGI95_12855 [Caulobacteraceae bacterium]|jgi:hypothetical protein
MSVTSLRPFNPLRAASNHPVLRRLGRGLAVGVGGVLMVIGGIGAVLPGHLGAPVLVVGLVISLRASFRARRQFIDLQRRHPKVLFPIRRLLRREPEIAPVAWQTFLRSERILPRRLRIAVRLRHRFFRRRAALAT